MLLYERDRSLYTFEVAERRLLIRDEVSRCTFCVVALSLTAGLVLACAALLVWLVYPSPSALRLLVAPPVLDESFQLVAAYIEVKRGEMGVTTALRLNGLRLLQYYTNVPSTLYKCFVQISRRFDML